VVDEEENGISQLSARMDSGTSSKEPLFSQFPLVLLSARS